MLLESETLTLSFRIVFSRTLTESVCSEQIHYCFRSRFFSLSLTARNNINDCSGLLLNIYSAWKDNTLFLLLLSDNVKRLPGPVRMTSQMNDMCSTPFVFIAMLKSHATISRAAPAIGIDCVRCLSAWRDSPRRSKRHLYIQLAEDLPRRRTLQVRPTGFAVEMKFWISTDRRYHYRGLLTNQTNDPNEPWKPSPLHHTSYLTK